MQITAVDGDVGKTVALDRLHAEVEQLPALAGIPESDCLAGRQHLHALQRRFESQRMQHARAIGTDLHASPELAQFGRLFINFNVDTASE